MCVCIGKNTVFIGFGAIRSFRHSLRSWNVSPADKGCGYYTHESSFILIIHLVVPFNLTSGDCVTLEHFFF